MEDVCQDVLREEKIRGNVRCWITMQPCFRVHHVLGEEADLCVLGERCWPHTLSPSTVCVASSACLCVLVVDNHAGASNEWK